MFKIFVNGTTSDASELMANFSYFGSGDLLPCANTSTLDHVDGVSDLGSTDYKWYSIYTKQISASSAKTYELVTSTYVTSTCSSIDISGIDVSGDDGYMIYVSSAHSHVSTAILEIS